jgi:ubiquinone/menaquinone biosynthesis C-methylase UbiE
MHKLGTDDIMTRLCRSDLNMPLPFCDNAFSCIVCNLVLGHLRDPAFTMRELVRILADGGRLIISGLKPDADGFAVYSKHLYAHRGADGLESGRRWLTDFARMRTDAANGLSPLFGANELRAWLQEAGATSPRFYTSFAGQVFLAISSKPPVTRSETITGLGLEAHA